MTESSHGSDGVIVAWQRWREHRTCMLHLKIAFVLVSGSQTPSRICRSCSCHGRIRPAYSAL
jgi:hypothetical protein